MRKQEHGRARRENKRTKCGMKFALLILLLVIGASSGYAGSLSLEAHEIGTGSATYTNWADDYGGFDRDYSRSKEILVTVHDLSRNAASFDITVYFIARPTVPPADVGQVIAHPFVYDRIETSQNLNGALEVKGTFPSRTLAANAQNYPLIGRSHASGADMDGWIVIGISEGREFGVCASSQTLLAIAQGRSDESFAEMVRQYENKHPSSVAANPTPAPIIRPALAPVASVPAQSEPTTVAKYVTLIRPTEVSIQYGKVTLPVGTRLEVLSRDATTVTAKYLGETIVLSLSSTDFK
jgi:hypothetical protein